MPKDKLHNRIIEILRDAYNISFSEEGFASVATQIIKELKQECKKEALEKIDPKDEEIGCFIEEAVKAINQTGQKGEDAINIRNLGKLQMLSQIKDIIKDS